VILTNAWYRLATYAADGSDIATHKTPQSILEQAGQGSAQSVTVPRSTGISGYKLSLVELLVPRANASSFLSSPFGLRFDQSPCNTSSLAESNYCSIIVTLQNWDPLSDPYQETFVNESAAELIEFTCSDNEENMTALCTNGRNVTAFCNGTAGMIYQPCPQESFTAVRVPINRKRHKHFCELMNFTSTTITCQCNLNTGGGGGVGGGGNRRMRRLQEDGIENDDSSISVDFTSAGESVVTDFTETWGSLDDLSFSDVMKSVQVLLTMLVIAIVSVVLVLLAWREDVKDIKKEQQKQEAFLEHHKSQRFASKTIVDSSSGECRSSTCSPTPPRPFSGRISFRGFRKQRVIEDQGLSSSHTETIESVADMLSAALPNVMQPLPLWAKYKNEIKAYHRWGGIYFHYSNAYSRPLRMLSLITNVILFLFVEAVIYEIADPDDGFCEEQDDLSACLAEPSAFSSGESKCYWDEEAISCHIREIDGSILKVVIVAIFASSIGTPFVVLLQILIQKYLAAETTNGNKQFKKVSPTTQGAILRRGTSRHLSRASLNRAVSILPVHASNAGSAKEGEEIDRATLFDSDGNLITTTSLREEIPLFFADVQGYRASLSANDCKEFDEVWGFSFGDEDNFFHWIKKTFMRIFRKMLKKDAQSVDLVLVAELKRVHDVVIDEMYFFGRQDVNNADKNKRLINLFVKDLLSSANGKILENKHRRDNSPRGKVSLRVKIFIWVFITLMLASMLLYVYLFAMRQTARRQNAWFQTFIVWLLFEIALVSSGIVYVIIPSYILNDLKTVRKNIIADINNFKTKLDTRLRNKKAAIVSAGGENTELSDAQIKAEKDLLNKEMDERTEFNWAAKYLYVSHRLAKVLPQLPISCNVLQFSTPWPNQSLKEDNKMSDNYNAKFTFVGQSVSKIVYFMLLGLDRLLFGP
jgi:hypothetical protein